MAVTSNSEFNDLVKEFNKNHNPGIEPIYSDKGAAENLNLVATGRADAAGEYEYVVNVARKEQKLPVQAVGSVMQSVPTYFLLRKDPAMQTVADKIDKVLKQMKEDGTLKQISIKYLGKDYTVQLNKKGRKQAWEVFSASSTWWIRSPSWPAICR